MAELPAYLPYPFQVQLYNKNSRRGQGRNAGAMGTKRGGGWNDTAEGAVGGLGAAEGAGHGVQLVKQLRANHRDLVDDQD